MASIMFKQKHRYKIFHTLVGVLISLSFTCYSMSSKPASADTSTITPAQPSSPSSHPSTDSPAQTAKPQYCPLAKELTKQDLIWTVGDTWKSYSESFVNKIGSFVGAQWVGIRVGKIICLYKGENSFDFPIALEQVKSKIITEPSGAYWSALVNNHKFCQSANVFDCPYYVQIAEDITQIYKAIEYKPQAPQSTNSLDF